MTLPSASIVLLIVGDVWGGGEKGMFGTRNVLDTHGAKNTCSNFLSVICFLFVNNHAPPPAPQK